MLDRLQNLMDKFRINIKQIINNSDNELEDVRNEGFIVLHNFLDDIRENENVFINELRNSCLKFNKYSVRITEKARWERYNRLEEIMVEECNNSLDTKEDIILGMEVIKHYTTKKELEFLLHYYRYGGQLTSIKYGLKECTVRKRVNNIIKRIKKELREDE